MSGSPAAAFHAAKLAALRASTGLATAMGGAEVILVDVPANQPVPYVVADEDQVLLEDGDCGGEAEIFCTVQWWSLTEPLDEGAQARAMGAAIVAALNAALAVTGWVIHVWSCESERYFTDPDQSTHGRAEFRYLLTESAA